MNSKKFSTLQLNKKKIAKLSVPQLMAVRGGKDSETCRDGGITCTGQGSTIILKQEF